MTWGLWAILSTFKIKPIEHCDKELVSLSRKGYSTLVISHSYLECFIHYFLRFQESLSFKNLFFLPEEARGYTFFISTIFFCFYYLVPFIALRFISVFNFERRNLSHIIMKFSAELCYNLLQLSSFF